MNQSRTKKGGGESAREMMVVLGSGGHTNEMLTILEALLNDKRAERISTLHLVLAETDQGSVARAKKLLEGRQLKVEWQLIPRSREVGQRPSGLVDNSRVYSFAPLRAVMVTYDDVSGAGLLRDRAIRSLVTAGHDNAHDSCAE
ncbi:hypothetical protein FOL46_007716 [Perkinsus olseni]|uniref:UDP-N-acetylglucosamine transferase subunit ALG14 n=1 Tax=Perkinsus olseni TaxID=32597 RepID=A0A7J6LBS9_PEROL|nr:hypothetical protein FOL46_007716 [Perkinsus olseni]